MKDSFSSSTSRRNLGISLGVLLVAAVIYFANRSPHQDAASQLADAPKTVSSARSEGITNGGEVAPGSDSRPAPAASDSKNPPQDSDSDTTLSRAAKNRTTMTASGVRKQLIDPMASWSEQPAWPEGPRLYAEVETSGKRYVNLRPDDVGELPRIQTDAEEKINITISIPEGDPGEKIHIELPNGGSFPDSESKGRIIALSENRTLSFPYITDRVVGFCNGTPPPPTPPRPTGPTASSNPLTTPSPKATMPMT